MQVILMSLTFEQKIIKFLYFLETKTELRADFYNRDFNDNKSRAYVTLVPYDFDISSLPQFKKYCKSIGLKFTSEFKCDENRTNGYYQYHEIIIENDIIQIIKNEEKIKELIL